MRTNSTAAFSSAGTGSSFGIRHESEAGDEYLVAPAVLFQEGVYSYRANGGIIREYLPADELTKDPTAWNGTPVTIGHPEVDDQFVSVSDSAATAPVVGELRDVHANESQLRGEVWFRESARGEYGGTAAAIAEALEADEVVEVSPGYVPTVEGTSGRFNGTAYDAIQRDPTPDHFALLPDETGNCSVEAGCGVGTPRANHAMSNDSSEDASLRAGGSPVRANEATGAGTPVAPDHSDEDSIESDEGLWRTIYATLDSRFNAGHDDGGCGCGGHDDGGCACDSESDGDDDDDVTANAGDDDESTDGDESTAGGPDDQTSTTMSDDEHSERIERLAANFAAFDADDLANMTDEQLDEIDPDAGATDPEPETETEPATETETEPAPETEPESAAEIAANKAAEAVAEQYEERLNALEEKVEAPEREFEARLNEKLAEKTSYSEEAIEGMDLTAKQEALEQATDSSVVDPTPDPRANGNFYAVQTGTETRENSETENVGTGDFGEWLAGQEE